MARSRRELLELGGVAVGTVPLVGCLGGGGTETGESPDRSGTAPGGESTSTTTAGGGESTRTAGGERPATDLAGYTEWLPAPSAVEFVPDTGYAFQATAPAQLVELAGALGDGATEPLTRALPTPGLETLGDAAAVVRLLRSGFVYETSVDREATEAGFEDRGFTAEGIYRGFTVLSPDSRATSRAAAVGDDAIVTVGRFSSDDETDKRPALEAVIDAKTGNAVRYTETLPDCGRLVDALGTGHLVTGRTHEAGATFDGAVGEGTSVHVGETDSRVRAGVAFADDADESAVAEWARDAPIFFGTAPTTRVDGRVVTAAATVSSGAITEFPSGFPGPPIPDQGPDVSPQVSFGFGYEPTGDTRGLLTVTHEGGDSVPAGELFVRGSGFADAADADQTSAGPWQGTVSGDGNVIAGDRVVVGVAADYEVRIAWRSADGDDSATLATTDGPDA